MNDSNEPALASGAHGCETELQELCFHKHLSTSGIIKLCQGHLHAVLTTACPPAAQEAQNESATPEV